MAMMEVRYVGPSAYRLLTAADLKQHGIGTVTLRRRPTMWERQRVVADGVPHSDENLLWGPQNSHSIVMDVTPDLETLLRRERHFAIVALGDDGEPQERVVEPAKEDAEVVTGVVVYEEEGKPTQKVRQTGERRDLPA